MFNRFTERARKVLVLAKEEARRFNHDYIGTEHILLGLIREGEGVACAVLQNIGMDIGRLRAEIEKLMSPGAAASVLGDIPFTPRAKKALELATEEARSLGHNYIGTEHILLGLLREEEGIASQVLFSLGVDIRKAKSEISSLLGGAAGTSHSQAKRNVSKTPALDSFGRDLTKLQKEGELDPVIGRRAEIERVIQVLSRRTKNNPVLLGEAGVGKTAIVEGLAQSVVRGDVPEILRSKRIVVLDLALMIAGTKYRGQFEERIKAVMEEIKRSKDVIIFVDELHTLVGAGAAEGAIDASNILKPALSRGEIQCIGATTLDEYRKHIEKDAALARRFQMIFVEPNTVSETIQILEGLRDKYEAHHRVKFTNESLQAAAKFSDRYISGRFLPDKAIDLVDEAGARSRLAKLTTPGGIKKLEEKIAEIIREKEAFIRQQDFEQAAKLRDEEKKLRFELDNVRKEWSKKRDKISPEVKEEDIAQLVSQVTGVPAYRLEQKESEKLIKMEDTLSKKVIGQREAIKAISRAVRRARAGVKEPRRPIGSFMFLGPTGVGKTLLARALAEFMFGNEEALIQLDMSEYMEKFNVSRLVGAPPGYVGYEEGGQLTERVRRRPYSVILLDEIEKAHPDVYNLLLQILEEGRLTDSYGRPVDFRNVILIMTSNVGADIIRQKGSLGFKTKNNDIDYEGMKSSLLDEVKKTFKPEFLNRLDEITVFRSLDKKSLEKIVELEMAYVNERLKEQGFVVTLTSGAKELFIEKGFDPSYGARPLKRAIQRFVEDPLAEDIIRGKFSKRIKEAKEKPITVKALKKGQSLKFE
ncbi:MAG: ATP-dependent Clp protease ATP-binding subunit [Candidatus Omnitrophica bacterium]|nr:ATP-dependent Clp protease ATP-binding subunit [Candidatus Omnitrophota bacterium]MCF7877461.1 ATP-dependent Clp protease ATP-binding subunit [Candidatus Omnitrophota bacterium]MCF7878636.1 ATP-dependent Clp protease ATP-binding subunit [Candidatus Omnitrophota bacterium]MCF7892811.1 ATP-dependent Clp protease ATP-binding subunit [Candidatus Omnitrophota bacterium]